jgi:hypothetical protein
MLWIKHPLQGEQISFRTGVPYGVPYGVSYGVPFEIPYEVPYGRLDDAPYEGSDEMYTHNKCP